MLYFFQVQWVSPTHCLEQRLLSTATTKNLLITEQGNGFHCVKYEMLNAAQSLHLLFLLNIPML